MIRFRSPPEACEVDGAFHAIEVLSQAHVLIVVEGACGLVDPQGQDVVYLRGVDAPLGDGEWDGDAGLDGEELVHGAGDGHERVMVRTVAT